MAAIIIDAVHTLSASSYSNAEAMRAFLPIMILVPFLTWIGTFMLRIFSLPLIATLLDRRQELSASVAIRWVGICFALPATYARLGKVRTHDLALLGVIAMVPQRCRSFPVHPDSCCPPEWEPSAHNPDPAPRAGQR